MRYGDGSAVAPPSHGDRPRDIHAIDPGDRRWWRGTGYICGALSGDFEVGDMYGGWVPGEVTQYG